MNNVRLSCLTLLGVFGIGFGLAACTSVDTVRFTNQTFPPKKSVEDVQILDRKPACNHIVIARLSVDESEYDSFETEQKKILKKAASLGADAVVFSQPQKSVRQGVAYTAAGGPYGYGMYGYPGWGYGAGYGYGMGWGNGGMAVPYNYTVKSLKGVAIHYSDSNTKKC